jgi:hypothetical protein
MIILDILYMRMNLLGEGLDRGRRRSNLPGLATGRETLRQQYRQGTHLWRDPAARGTPTGKFSGRENLSGERTEDRGKPNGFLLSFNFCNGLLYICIYGFKAGFWR